MLVLAIAGLIFLMVFIALPALQRSQRDTQRKQDMARVAAAYNSYVANNRGCGIRDNDWRGGMPVWNSFLNAYLRNDGEEFKDPLGSDYRIEEGPRYTEGRSQIAGDGVISVNLFTICEPSEDKNVTIVGDANKITARLRLESGGVHCVQLN